jgi:hypothetical protein
MANPASVHQSAPSGIIQRVPEDSEGRRLLSSGVWNSNTTLSISGGQGMHFALQNMNVLGTTIRITDQMNQTQARVLLPRGTADMVFTCFGEEPMGWRFRIETQSDAFLVGWNLYSTWVPGEPPNR